jgi:hypothetical protein
MTQNNLFRFVVLSVCCLLAPFIEAAAADVERTHSQLLSGNRVLLGTVQEVRSDQVRINTGDLTSRFVPMGVRKAKDLAELTIGDLVEVTVNDQNLLVDVHKAGESGHHRVVPGQLATPMKTGHDAAVMRTMEGEEESHFVRPVARSKVASIPVGADVSFLIDEMDRIVDVTMGSVESVHRSAALGQQKSPLKGNLSQIAGKILSPLKADNTIGIWTEDGKKHFYHVRPLIQQRFAALFTGDAVVLLVDEENKVTDVAFLPKK